MKHEIISEKYRKWVIEFYSEEFLKPVFFVWLTDLSDKDQILTAKRKRIIAAKSKKKLISRISKSKTKLPDSKRTKKWLKESSNCSKISSTKHDLRKIENKILSNKLKPDDIETIVNFINLYEDYKTQLCKKSTELKPRTRQLDKIWNYYYDEIFFPNFKGKKKKKFRPSKFKIDNKKLLKEFSKIVRDFEGNFS